MHKPLESVENNAITLESRRPDDTGEISGRWKPGQSGNPAGRPKSARGRYSEDFIKAYADDFEQHGVAVLEQVRTNNPVEWLKIGQKLFAAIMPKDVTITSELGAETMSFLMAYRMIGAAPDKQLLAAEIIDGEE